MEEKLVEVVESLEILLDEDLSSKPRLKLQEIIEKIKDLEEVEPSRIMEIQDDLEMLSAMDLDSFSRNEIVNVLTLIETLI